MRKIISILCIFVAVALTASAQSNITIKSLAVPDLTHNNSGNPINDPVIVASKSYLRLIGSFNPNSSGSCSFPYPESCRGMRVALNFGSGLVFSKLISVSTTELRVIMPNIPSNGNYPLCVQKDYGGIWVTEIYESSIQCRRNCALPFSTYYSGVLYPNGSLYGMQNQCDTPVALASISDAVNPRCYPSCPRSTFLQLYYTGIHSDDYDDNIWVVETTFSPGKYLRRFDGIYSEGVYVINIFPSGETSPCGGGWIIGFSEQIKLGVDRLGFFGLQFDQFTPSTFVNFDSQE